MTIRIFSSIAATAGLVAVSAFIATGPAEAAGHSQTSAQVVGTGGIGVSCRSGPTQASNDCGYGAPEHGTVRLVCFVWNGDPVGSNGNTTWWKVIYGSKTFFVSDHWLDTPAPVNHIPTWYNGTGCL